MISIDKLFYTSRCALQQYNHIFSEQSERCMPRPLRQVFTYQRKVCQLLPERKTKTETWLNDKLHKVRLPITNGIYLSSYGTKICVNDRSLY